MRVELSKFHSEVKELGKTVSESQLSGAERYDILEEFDPYIDDIPPALLNSGHLATYALTTGMIEPFDASNLTKPATYLVSAEGPVRYRNAEGHVERFYLTNDMEKRNSESCVRNYVRLAPNSVCFLTLEPTFRMPSYIAARFNLLIRDVYRGLLVGTGPLVDPGFHGKLSIPIHNFTTGEYFIQAGEGLVYFEFTKLSWANPDTGTPKISWLPKPINNQPPFPAKKNDRRTLDDYLAQATGGGPPQNSVQQTSNSIKNQYDETKRILNIYTLGGAIAAVALIYTGFSVYISSQQFVASAQTEMRESRYQLAKEVHELRALVQDYRKQLSAVEAPPALPTPGK